MKKAALYVRVSTLEQAREGYSINAQAERLQAYAKAKNYGIYDTYIDAGESGSKLERPEMKRLIRDAKAQFFNAVIVIKLDRLSRSQKDTLHLIQDIFQPNNVDFISMNESFDTSTSFGIAMIGILSVFAELERANIRERMQMGRVERAKAGYYHGGGNHDPLGYDYIDGELIINDYEAEVVKDTFKLYLDGNSMNTTKDILKEKYPDVIKSFTLVKDTLKRELYIGNVEFDGKVYKGLHDPIIDEETFNLAQKKRKERAVGASRTNKRKGLLVGRIYCAHCGARYFREVTGSRKYRYVKYVCRSKDRSRGSVNMIKDRNCQNKRWNEEELDKKIIDYLKEIDYNKIKEESTMEIVDYDKMIAKTDKEIERAVKLYTTSKISISILNQTTDDLNKKRENLIDKKNEQEDRMKNKEKSLVYSMNNFDWKNASKYELMHVVDTLIDRIELDDNNVDIHFNF